MKTISVPVNPVTIAGWKQVSICPVNEPLVPLGIFAEYPRNLVHTDMIYAGETSASPYVGGLVGSLLTAFVRKGIAERLEKARQLLPEGMTFVVWDPFRPLDVQKSLFDWFYTKLKNEHTDFSEEELMAEAQKFVSLPSTDPTKPSPHNTGAVVDLSIIQLNAGEWRNIQKEARKLSYSTNWQDIYQFEMEKAKMFRGAQVLPMGTVFDEVSEKTMSNYYELNGDVEPLWNRRLFYSVMSAVGFENYEEEWWHFSYGDQFWGKKTGKNAFYGAAQLSPENIWWEKNVRRGHYVRNLAWTAGEEDRSGKLGDLVLSFARQVARAGFGRLSETAQPQACIL